MGTSTDRRSRRSKRGLASFVSFLLLFAFALGQGSSMFALADTDPVATGKTSSRMARCRPRKHRPRKHRPRRHRPRRPPAEEAPAEEATGRGGTGRQRKHRRRSEAPGRRGPRPQRPSSVARGRRLRRRRRPTPRRLHGRRCRQLDSSQPVPSSDQTRTGHGHAPLRSDTTSGPSPSRTVWSKSLVSGDFTCGDSSTSRSSSERRGGDCGREGWRQRQPLRLLA